MQKEVSQEFIEQCIFTHLADKHLCPPSKLIQRITQMCAAYEQPILNAIWHLLDSGKLELDNKLNIIIVD